MKNYIVLFLSLILVLCFSSCALNLNMPDTVTIEGKEYKKAFVGELYPFDETASNDGVKVSGNLYCKYSQTPYDCYIAYDRDAEPNVYFEVEKFDEAKLYYSDSNNFNFFCLMGNIHDENDQQIIHLENINHATFDSLLEFSKNNDYNPFTSFNNEEDLIKIPIADPDDWMADEIHYYKESKDGAFITSKGYTFILHENKLYVLYQYDFGNDEVPVMLVRAVPSEVGDYFCTLLKELKNE